MITSREVCRRANITYRQLDYWLRLGVIHCETDDLPGCGRQRGWSANEALLARVVGDLTSLGMKLDQCRHVLSQLRRTTEPLRGPVFIDRGGLCSREPVVGTSYVLDMDELQRGLEDALASR